MSGPNSAYIDAPSDSVAESFATRGCTVALGIPVTSARSGLAAEVPPPGAEFATATLKVPAAEFAIGESCQLKCDASMYVVAIGCPLTRTFEAGLNPLPLKVRFAGNPAATATGNTAAT